MFWKKKEEDEKNNLPDLPGRNISEASALIGGKSNFEIFLPGIKIRVNKIQIPFVFIIDISSLGNLVGPGQDGY